MIEFKLNNQAVQAYEGESILKAAQRNGVDIPHLCYTDGLRADGNCRACVVEIKGERTLAPSCCRNATAGLEVLVSERAVKSQKMVLEMLLSDMPDQGYKWNDEGQHGELSHWASRMREAQWLSSPCCPSSFHL
jgi:formate dehydrogenase major subunit